MAEKWAFIGQPGILLYYRHCFPSVLVLPSPLNLTKLTGVSCKQVYYYQDVKCRDEMFDKDIVMLQVGSQT